nr:VOC family protein [Chlorobium sp. KB01]
MKFVHVALSCTDLEKTEAFYARYFNFRRARFVPLDGGNAIVFIRCDDFCLELFKSSEERPVPQPANDGQNYPGWRHIAFQVDNLGEFMDQFGNELSIALGPLDFSSFIPHWKSVWVRDPDGNIIEVSQGYQDEKQGNDHG